MAEDVESGHNSSTGDHVAIQTDTYAIDKDALGTELPPKYWISPGFIGTVIALCLGNISNYLGWVMPSNSLALIDASIGPSDNISWVALSYTLGLSIGFLIVGRLSVSATIRLRKKSANTAQGHLRSTIFLRHRQFLRFYRWNYWRHSTERQQPDRWQSTQRPRWSRTDILHCGYCGTCAEQTSPSLGSRHILLLLPHCMFWTGHRTSARHKYGSRLEMELLSRHYSRRTGCDTFLLLL